MPMFEEKSPQVEAEQWDGTLEGFRKIQQLIVKSRVSVGYFVRTEPLRTDGDLYSTIEFDRDLDDYRRMRPRMWLVKTRHGSLRLLHDEEFQATYASIEETNNG